MPGEDEVFAVQVTVEPALDGRNRLTTLFRLILALPHLILVGGPSLFGLPAYSYRRTEGNVTTRYSTNFISAGGVIGVVAFFAALFSWFAIVFTGRQPKGLWDLTHFYLRWRVRANAYTALLRDEYPPFGEGDYAAELRVSYPEESRNRLTVGFRPILAIPHFIVLLFVNIAWFVSIVIAWFCILLTGTYPRGLYGFGVGALRWNIRVESYLLLMRDDYPPFST